MCKFVLDQFLNLRSLLFIVAVLCLSTTKCRNLNISSVNEIISSNLIVFLFPNANKHLAGCQKTN